MKVVKQLLDISGRILFVVFILASTYVFAMFQGGKVSWTIFYIILPFAVYSIVLFLYPLSEITGKRVIRTPNVQNGGKLIVSLSIRRKSFFPLLYTVVTEKWTEPEMSVLAGDQMKRLFILGIRKEMEWEYEIEHMPRGEHLLQGLEVEVSDFFGWIRKTKFIDLKSTILVFPKMTDVHYIPFDTQYDQGTMASPLNIVKDTTMATGVRNYQSGDRVTWIHWKSFARTQTLMTKEFEDRRSQELCVIMDGRETEVFEELVEFTASILKEAAEHQAGLALMTTGQETTYFPFIKSGEQLHRALVHLAKIKPTEKEDNAVINVDNTSQHGGSIVVLTGNPDWSFMQSVLQGVKNSRSVVCYTIAGREKRSLETVENNIRIAKSKGITVHLLEQDQFSEAFKKVGRL